MGRNDRANSYSQILDPDLQFYSGAQYAGDEKSNFGVFLDSSPDRWGRLLMRRREAALAKSEGRSEKTLREKLASPPWTALRELEEISLKLEDDSVINDPQYWKWLNMLVNPGSSLGGARPKASVMDSEKNLWIAKFPRQKDTKDIGGWEMVANELAINAGLNIAVSRVQKFSNRHYTFLTKRFDRTNKGERIHYASTMTMLGYSDRTDFHDGAS